MEMPLHVVFEKEREIKTRERKRVKNIIDKHIHDAILKRKINNEIDKGGKNA
jgi:hypothetical protein